MKLPANWRKPVIFASALLVLVLVFVSYLNPHLAVDLASRIWACF